MESQQDTTDKTPNRLINETSPYLLQHAYNPVNWYPWGEEAFEKARAEERAIFLSVGYSACHWCHVMERESFENDEIAALLNERFVCIKVDREERPDVDSIYMSAVQLLTQRGGWPMSVFLTPDGRPFYGGTYWPPTARMGMPGFRDVIIQLGTYWTDRRDEVEQSAATLHEALERMAAPEFEEQPITVEILRDAMRVSLSSADRVHGGFGNAPKFPHPMDVRALLRAHRRFNDDDALSVARLTLDKMASGGMYDHLGGGFHRYSTDARWLVPHFEKMLYDNALLIPAYVEAFQLTGEESYRNTVIETLDYVLREMTQPEGGFYSTQDADSEGEEGKFFVWTEAEVVSLLGEENARLFNYAYDVTPGGNWEGNTILNRPKDENQAAKMLGVDVDELRSTLAICREKLFETRKKRIAPGRDDKVLVGWNGLMISAIARAQSLWATSDNLATNSLDTAKQAADFILTKMRDKNGYLLHSFKDGQARFNAYLDDYACLIDGLTELYQATFEPRWLGDAVEIAEQMRDRFADPDNGGFFYTANDHEQLITRTKDSQDSATPSGNSMAAYALLRLGRLTGRGDLEDLGYETLVMMSGLLAKHPRAAGQSLLAVDFHLGPAYEVAIVDGTDHAASNELIGAVRSGFHPNTLLARRPPVSDDELPATLAALFKGRIPDKQPSAYVCERGACQLPVTTAEELRRTISK